MSKASLSVFSGFFPERRIQRGDIFGDIFINFIMKGTDK